MELKSPNTLYHRFNPTSTDVQLILVYILSPISGLGPLPKNLLRVPKSKDIQEELSPVACVKNCVHAPGAGVGGAGVIGGAVGGGAVGGGAVGGGAVGGGAVGGGAVGGGAVGGGAVGGGGVGAAVGGGAVGGGGVGGGAVPCVNVLNIVEGPVKINVAVLVTPADGLKNGADTLN